MRRVLAVLVLALTAVAGVAAAELRPFVAGSLAEIRAAHAGRPFVLALWSLDCPHCGAELTLLGQLHTQHPGLALVVVSTDSPLEREALGARLREHGLADAEAWVYADAFSERLRFEIDPRWGGELPRVYLYDRQHTRRAHSGRLDTRELERWIAEQVTPAATPAR